MARKSKSLLFLLSSALLCIQTINVLGSPRHQKKSLTRTELSERKLLPGFIVAETPARSLLRCVAACLRVDRCRSVNYHAETERCLLGNTSVVDSIANRGEALFVEDPIEQCVPNPCQNGALCDGAGRDGEQTFSCMCLAGTFGRRCQIKRECAVALGMESTAIQDTLVTASSSADGTHTAARARLNLPAAGWTAAAGDAHPWLRVQLIALTEVTGIVTQGFGVNGGGWVTRFELAYTDASGGTTQVNYKDYSGQRKIFSGNIDTTSEMKHFLDPVIKTRSLTLFMLEWNVKCSARLEILGCYIEDFEWLLAFKGRAEIGRAIYEAWTTSTDDPTQNEADRSLNSLHHYRDNLIFHLWNNLTIHEVKLTLFTLNPKVECLVMRFNGTGSDATNWLGATNILQSPWSDLHQGITPLHGSMGGIEAPSGYRRFLFDKCTYSVCSSDCGWLIVPDCAPTCDCNWEGSLHGITVRSKIFYCKKKTVCNWNNIVDIGVADVLTIHVKF